MNTSNRVDVVIAEIDPEAVEITYGDQGESVEAVDVAPYPTRRIIVLAPTKQAGQEHAESLGIEPVAIVTPRSPHASYGMVADEIAEAPGLSVDVVGELMQHAGPSLATTGGE
ncbi:hypothetical protein [Microbacterium sp. MEJ108Y]|uniref:hypothetical protein n=1 Tax=Microbacterium sp. MEJ108Y TaxID=1587523 RepID=UPI000B2BD01A|nr:hypothetical protein [Microbacterium sp. MEJ108Y]